MRPPRPTDVRGQDPDPDHGPDPRPDPEEEARAKVARYVWEKSAVKDGGSGVRFEDFEDSVRREGFMTATSRLRDLENGDITPEAYLAGPAPEPLPSDPKGPDPERDDASDGPDPEEGPEGPGLDSGTSRIKVSKHDIMRIIEDVRSYNKRLISVQGMDAERAKAVTNDDLDVGARVRAAVISAARDQTPAQVSEADTATPAPLPELSDEDVRSETDRVMKLVWKSQETIGVARRREGMANDDAPMMSVRRRYEREDDGVDTPSI